MSEKWWCKPLLEASLQKLITLPKSKHDMFSARPILRRICFEDLIDKKLRVAILWSKQKVFLDHIKVSFTTLRMFHWVNIYRVHTGKYSSRYIRSILWRRSKETISKEKEVNSSSSKRKSQKLDLRKCIKSHHEWISDFLIENNFWAFINVRK